MGNPIIEFKQRENDELKTSICTYRQRVGATYHLFKW